MFQEAQDDILWAGTAVETKGIFAGILNIFAQIKTELRFNEETRKEYRRRISVRSSEWIRILGQVSETITDKTGG